MTTNGTSPGVRDLNVGLCAACTCARQIISARGSTFWLCERSKTDPTFPRYPRLPVVVCSGFNPVTPER
jgi:hypothetical protein